MAMISSPSSGSSRSITTYECKICSASFSFASSAEQHVRGCHPEAFQSAYVCTICEERFLTKSEAEAHARLSHPELFESSYQCNICKKKFSTEGETRTHIHEHHPEKTKKVECPGCGRNFSMSEILNHLENSHPEIMKLLAQSYSSRATQDIGTPVTEYSVEASNIDDSNHHQKQPSTSDEKPDSKPWWKLWA